MDSELLYLPSSEAPTSSTLLVISQQPLSEEMMNSMSDCIGKNFRLIFCKSHCPNSTEVFGFAEELKNSLQLKGIKRFSLLGIDRGASVAKALVFLFPRNIRRLILVDAKARVNPSLTTRFTDKIERFLPLGLPFRRLSQDFDSRPFLHRIHCPSLIVRSAAADETCIEQMSEISKRIPNAWTEVLDEEVFDTRGKFSKKLSASLLQFSETPVKCPQKNRPSESLAEGRVENLPLEKSLDL